MGPLGHLGLALSTSATSIANLVQLSWYLRRRIGPLGGRRMLQSLVRVSLAGIVMLAVCALLLLVLGDSWTRSLPAAALLVAGSLLLGLAVTYLAMRALGVEELAAVDDLARSLRSRLTGR
jgi:putative peptidoglycan lipid II flippase